MATTKLHIGVVGFDPCDAFLETLRAAGHEVVTLTAPNGGEWDLVLGPGAHYWHSTMSENKALIAELLKAARKRHKEAHVEHQSAKSV